MDYKIEAVLLFNIFCSFLNMNIDNKNTFIIGEVIRLLINMYCIYYCNCENNFKNFEIENKINNIYELLKMIDSDLFEKDGDADEDADGDADEDAGEDADGDADEDAGEDADEDAGEDADEDAGEDADGDAGEDADWDAGEDADGDAAKKENKNNSELKAESDDNTEKLNEIVSIMKTGPTRNRKAFRSI